jgi:hypothetical protein
MVGSSRRSFSDGSITDDSLDGLLRGMDNVDNLHHLDEPPNASSETDDAEVESIAGVERLIDFSLDGSYPDLDILLLDSPAQNTTVGVGVNEGDAMASEPLRASESLHRILPKGINSDATADQIKQHVALVQSETPKLEPSGNKKNRPRGLKYKPRKPKALKDTKEVRHCLLRHATFLSIKWLLTHLLQTCTPKTPRRKDGDPDRDARGKFGDGSVAV